MKIISTLLNLPNTSSIYAIYGIQKRSNYVLGIWQTSHLKKSIFSRLFGKLDDLHMGKFNGHINPQEVVEIRWWEFDKYYESHVRDAAVVIAKEVLNNEKPTEIEYEYINESTKQYINDQSFRSSMISTFTEEPTGVLRNFSFKGDLENIGELRKKTYHLLHLPKADELGILNSEEKRWIVQNIWKIDNPNHAVNIAYYLAFEHQYNELILDNTEQRKLFAISLSLASIYEKLLLSTFKHIGRSYRQGAVSALAVLISNDYELKIDAKKIYGELKLTENINHAGREIKSKRFSYEFSSEIPPIENPTIPYGDHFSVWPEFLSLREASIQAKKALIYIILRVGNNTRFISLDELPNNEILEAGIKYLSSKGLINDNPSPGELLGCLTYKDMSDFAIEMGHEKISRNKTEIINQINTSVDPREIETFINRMVNIERPVRPLIYNLPLIYKFIIEEMDRIDYYRLWIEKTRIGDA